jgi:hypothetical protein
LLAQVAVLNDAYRVDRFAVQCRRNTPLS